MVSEVYQGHIQSGIELQVDRLALPPDVDAGKFERSLGVTVNVPRN